LVTKMATIGRKKPLRSKVCGLPSEQFRQTLKLLGAKNFPKAAWRTEREKLLNLFIEHFSDPQTFRAGALQNEPSH
jgi:hypothetical protein